MIYKTYPYKLWNKINNQKSTSKKLFGIGIDTSNCMRVFLETSKNMVCLQHSYNSIKHWMLFGRAWTHSDYPSQYLYDLIDLFSDEDKKAYKQCIMEPDEFEVYKQLPEKLTVYRSAFKDEIETYEDGENEDPTGYSFTLSKDIALKFNNVYWRHRHPDKIVYKVDIFKKDIIAYKDNREEKEIIIDILSKDFFFSKRELI